MAVPTAIIKDVHLADDPKLNLIMIMMIRDPSHAATSDARASDATGSDHALRGASHVCLPSQ
jgi:hypothetical protein